MLKWNFHAIWLEIWLVIYLHLCKGDEPVHEMQHLFDPFQA